MVIDCITAYPCRVVFLLTGDVSSRSNRLVYLLGAECSLPVGWWADPSVSVSIVALSICSLQGAKLPVLSILADTSL